MLHPDKTRFVDFRNTVSNGTTHPETNGTTFTFLGFTHIWGKSRAGKTVVRQVTADLVTRLNDAAEAVRAALAAVNAEIAGKLNSDVVSGERNGTDAFNHAPAIQSVLHLAIIRP